MHKKQVAFTVIGLILFLACAHASPTIMLVPFQTSGFSDYEESLLQSLMAALIQTTESYSVLSYELVELQLAKATGKTGKLSDRVSIEGIGKRLSADYILTGTMGKIVGAYLINLKLVDTTTGITLMTRSERSANLQSFLELAISLVRDVLEQRYDVSSLLPADDVERWAAKNSQILSHISKAKLATWAEKKQKTDTMASGDVVAINRALKAYLSENIPPGLSYQVGIYGMPSYSYDAQITEPVHPDGYYVSDGELGPVGSVALGLQYRFRTYPYIAIGLTGRIGILSNSYSYDRYEDGTLVNSTDNQEFPLFFSVGTFMEYPIILDSIGLIVGINAMRFFGGPYLMAGMRIGQTTMLYGTLISPFQDLEWPHIVSLMYSIPSGAR